MTNPSNLPARPNVRRGDLVQIGNGRMAYRVRGVFHDGQTNLWTARCIAVHSHMFRTVDASRLRVIRSASEDRAIERCAPPGC